MDHLTCMVEGCMNPSRSKKPRSPSGAMCGSHRVDAWRKDAPELSAYAKGEHWRARKRRWRQHLNKIKLASGCVDCGYNDHPEALDFDHVRGVKLFALSASGSKSWADIEAEIAKCEVRCKNCHAVRTAERRMAA